MRVPVENAICYERLLSAIKLASGNPRIKARTARAEILRTERDHTGAAEAFGYYSYLARRRGSDTRVWVLGTVKNVKRLKREIIYYKINSRL